MVVRELLAGDPSGEKPGGQVALCDVDFLIKTLMYGWQGPHFLRCSPSDDPMTIATASFVKFGRHGLFATYIDSGYPAPKVRTRPVRSRRTGTNGISGRFNAAVTNASIGPQLWKEPVFVPVPSL